MDDNSLNQPSDRFNDLQGLSSAIRDIRARMAELSAKAPSASGEAWLRRQLAEFGAPESMDSPKLDYQHTEASYQALLRRKDQRTLMMLLWACEGARDTWPRGKKGQPYIKMWGRKVQLISAELASRKVRAS